MFPFTRAWENCENIILRCLNFYDFPLAQQFSRSQSQTQLSVENGFFGKNYSSEGGKRIFPSDAFPVLFRVGGRGGSVEELSRDSQHSTRLDFQGLSTYISIFELHRKTKKPKRRRHRSSVYIIIELKHADDTHVELFFSSSECCSKRFQLIINWHRQTLIIRIKKYIKLYFSSVNISSCHSQNCWSALALFLYFPFFSKKAVSQKSFFLSSSLLCNKSKLHAL